MEPLWHDVHAAWPTAAAWFSWSQRPGEPVLDVYVTGDEPPSLHTPPTLARYGGRVHVWPQRLREARRDWWRRWWGRWEQQAAQDDWQAHTLEFHSQASPCCVIHYGS